MQIRGQLSYFIHNMLSSVTHIFLKGTGLQGNSSFSDRMKKLFSALKKKKGKIYVKKAFPHIFFAVGQWLRKSIMSISSVLAFLCFGLSVTGIFLTLIVTTLTIEHVNWTLHS